MSLMMLGSKVIFLLNTLWQWPSKILAFSFGEFAGWFDPFFSKILGLYVFMCPVNSSMILKAMPQAAFRSCLKSRDLYWLARKYCQLLFA